MVDGKIHDTAFRWIIGFDDRDRVTRHGQGWFGITDDFEFHVLQEWILDVVDNRMLDIDQGTPEIIFEPPIPLELIDRARSLEKRR
jgi:hypothetical protein